MELKQGYKRTDLGALPEDWEVVNLGRRATFKTGPFGSALHRSDYVNEGIPIVNPMQIVDGKIIPTPTMTISPAAAAKLSEFRLACGDVVIGRRGEMGRCAYIGAAEHGWLCGTGSMIVRTRSTLDARYLQRVLSSARAINEIEDTSVGSTMTNLNQQTLANLKLAIPPTMSEQQAIAEALSDADALIESLEQFLTKKRHIKQGAMQELLTGKRRLSGFSKAWDVKRLGSVLSFQVGHPFSSVFFNEEGKGVRLVRNGDLKTDQQRVYYSGRFASEFLIEDGDLLVSMDGDFSTHVWGRGQALLNQRVGRVLPTSGLNRTFASFSLISPLKAIENATSRTTVKHLSHGDLEDVEMRLPTVKEQDAIASVLSDMDAEVTVVQAKLSKIRQLKQGMMQLLLTGCVRLLDAETMGELKLVQST